MIVILGIVFNISSRIEHDHGAINGFARLCVGSEILLSNSWFCLSVEQMGRSWKDIETKMYKRGQIT